MDSSTQITWTPAAANGGITYEATFNGPIYTVATLPTAQYIGQQFIVSDATLHSSNLAVVGGGSVVTPVFWTGSAWFIL